MIGTLLAVAPSLISLITSKNKTEAAVELTKTVVNEASKALGIEAKDEDELLQYLKSNPQEVFKLKELESQHALRIEELKLESKKIDYENEQKQEENVTQRWNSDNNSDSRFAKLLRPALTAYLVLIVTVLALFDGNVEGFNIKVHWVELFTALCITAVGGYFTLRTYEKRTGTSKWR